ncbi:MAG: hypothetical protein ACRD11_05655 [Terriglobia bacterium]
MVELGNTSNPSADYCLLYNAYANVVNPTSLAVPSQGAGDDGNVMAVFNQDNVNPGMSHTAAYQYDSLNRQKRLPVLDQKPRQLPRVLFPNDVKWFLHDGSPFFKYSQPDSILTGLENRRSTSNGKQDTFVQPTETTQ